jgi:hypothetical protein
VILRVVGLISFMLAALYAKQTFDLFYEYGFVLSLENVLTVLSALVWLGVHFAISLFDEWMSNR